MPPNTIGAILMMLSMACFTLNDTFVKLAGAAIPLFQLMFLRGVVTTALILSMRGRLGAITFTGISQQDWKLIGLRSLTEVLTAYFFMSALLNMPLANVTAIMQVLPLSVTLASALILREAVGWQRMSAIAVGFVGVLLIVKPGAEGFNIWSIYALIAMLCVTVRDLITRKLSPEVTSMTVTLITAVSVMGTAGVASIGQPWVSVSAVQFWQILASAVLILGAYYFSIQVMRVADVSATAPFRYTGLVFALLIGFVVFGDWPAWSTLLGAGIVAATGLFTLYRERRLAQLSN